MLAGVRIALTRPREQSAEMAEAIIEFGGIPLFFPLIQTDIRDSQTLKDAVAQPCDAVFFTSQNGVVAYLAARAAQGLTALSAPPVYCVGAQTTRVASMAGLRVVATPVVAAVSELFKVAPGMPVTKNLSADEQPRALLIQGQLADDALATGLTQAGWRVTSATGYDTRTTEAAPELLYCIMAETVQVITFASGSAVNALLASLAAVGEPDRKQMLRDRLKQNVLIASLGPKTTAILLSAGFPPQITATHASGRRLIEEVVNYIAAGNDNLL